MGLQDTLKKVIGPALDSGNRAFGPQNYEFFMGSGSQVRQYITGQSGDVKFALDSLMFAFPALDIKDSYSLFDYEFVIHNGQKVIARLVLPIPPQSVSYNVPTAVTTTVTMRGITEEHNGAPLRQIQLGGTTGVYPIQPASAKSASGKKGALDYFFANTVQSLNRVAQRVDRITAAFSDDTGPFKSSLIDQPDEWTQTGYTIAANIDRFFSAYLEAKKSGTTQLYLGYNQHKDKQYWDVTLNNFAVRKQAGSVEYMYAISMTAWKRREAPIGNNGAAKSQPSVNSQQAPNIFARINGVLNDARVLIGETLFVLKGVQGDIEQNILAPLKTVGLLIKDASGLDMVITDFSKAVVSDARSSIKAAWAKNLNSKNNSEAMENAMRQMANKGLFAPNSPSPILAEVVMDENDTAYAERVVGEQTKAQADKVTAQVASDKVLTDLRSSDTTAKTNSKTALTAELKRLEQLSLASSKDSASPINQVFENPDEFLDLLNITPINELELSSELQNAIDSEIDSARNLSFQDIANIRAQLSQFTALLSQRLGGQDAVYNQVFGLNEISTDKQLGTEDVDFLIKLDDAAAALDELVVILRDGDKTDENDYAKFYGEYARTQGIDFQENSSKFYVPFPFGASLESLAVQYLGDANRWIEIAAINGLKQPYIDELGTPRPFISSGSGNAFFVETSDSIYIGQIVTLSSDTQRAEPRRVIGFDIISEIQTIITVDGEADLARFKLSEKPSMLVYAPNTVNSKMLIAVPTTTPVNVPGNIQINPSERDLTNIGYVAKSDFLLINYQDGTSDIAFLGSDVAIAEGMTNLVQAANIKLRTKRGELVNDPDFGNPIEAGDSLAEFDANVSVAQLSALFAQDSRFNRVAAARIQVEGRAAKIDILLDVVKSQAYLPLTTVIPWI